MLKTTALTSSFLFWLIDVRFVHIIIILVSTAGPRIHRIILIIYWIVVVVRTPAVVFATVLPVITPTSVVVIATGVFVVVVSSATVLVVVVRPVVSLDHLAGHFTCDLLEQNKINMLSHFDGLVQERRNSSAL